MIENPPGPEFRPEPSMLRLAGTLALAGLLSGVTIVTAHVTTLPIIEANNARALERAVLKVVPGAASMQGLIATDGLVRLTGPGESPQVFSAFDENGQLLGFAIPGHGAGFQDTIRLIYGYDPSTREIVGMDVLESRETPGLGDKIYKDARFVAQFSGLATDPRIVCVKNGERSAPHEVDAITGATISSKAVVSIIAEANDNWAPLLREVESLPQPDLSVRDTSAEGDSDGGD